MNQQIDQVNVIRPLVEGNHDFASMSDMIVDWRGADMPQNS